MPDVQIAIEELRRCLQTSRDERELLLTISHRVAALRRAYREDRSLFSAEDVHFLRGLAPVEKALRSFVKETRKKPPARRRAGGEQMELL